jgi:hypothetical protein
VLIDARQLRQAPIHFARPNRSSAGRVGTFFTRDLNCAR